ncbi:MAG: TIGR02996 domain-containing protein [Planctomycetes bacterium]|nr:TIGR02996 domain-containing protein [Planctomycetota bacterium]
MTTEADFNRALDANPDDWQTRLVFADWLDERADPRAAGYRALGANRLRPLQDLRPRVTANWYFHTGGAGVLTHHPTIATVVNMIPLEWAKAVDPKYDTRGDALWVGYSLDRRVVEDALAAAFAKLPPERRAEVLAGIGFPEVPPAEEPPSPTRVPRRPRRKRP